MCLFCTVFVLHWKNNCHEMRLRLFQFFLKSQILLCQMSILLAQTFKRNAELDHVFRHLNPSEKYWSNGIISPTRDENTKYLTPPPGLCCGRDFFSMCQSNTEKIAVLRPSNCLTHSPNIHLASYETYVNTSHGNRKSPFKKTSFFVVDCKSVCFEDFSPPT